MNANFLWFAPEGMELLYHSSMSIIGVGIDLVETSRFLAAEISTKTLERIFTETELTYCRSKSSPELHLAARFAAKEAVVKALSPLGAKLLVSDIEVVKTETGGVIVKFLEKSRERFSPSCAALPKIHLSISHEKSCAVAMAVAEEI
jgi:holo-[acyl-carrier protein] synthase